VQRLASRTQASCPEQLFFHAQRYLGRAALRRLLLHGFSPSTALSLGVVTDVSLDSGNMERRCEKRSGDLPHTTSHILNLLQQRRVSSPTTPAPLNEQLAVLANIVGLSMGVPGKQHELTQQEVCERLGLHGTAMQGLFEAEHIETRNLAQLREPGFGFHPPGEDASPSQSPGQGVLTQKHLRWARALLVDTVMAACKDAGQPVSAVRYVSVCSSSGYLLPGLSAYLVNDLQLSRGTVRCDIVGMGCHAGLNSLQAAANWAALHPGQLAISCGVEVLSAHYMWKDSHDDEQDYPKRLNHALCNSLFSDGCFAAALLRPAINGPVLPCYATIHEFASQTSTDAIHTMTYQWDDIASQFWFHLSEEAPYAVGAALLQLLHDQQDLGMPIESIHHWVMHTGGQTVIDCAAAALGLDAAELNPTRSALRKFGNNSSVSFMFAYGEFLQSSPSPVVEGDLGVFITMGPGAGFELCLWSAGSRSASQCPPASRVPPLRRVADPPLAAGTPGSGNIKFGTGVTCIRV